MIYMACLPAVLLVPRASPLALPAEGLLVLLSVILLVSALLRARESEPQAAALHSVLAVAAALIAYIVAFTSLYWTQSYLVADCLTGPSLTAPDGRNLPATRPQAFYYTVVTMTATGTGDPTPGADVCRLIVSAQTLFSLIFLGVLLGTVTGALTRPARSPSIETSAAAPRRRQFRRAMPPTQLGRKRATPALLRRRQSSVSTDRQNPEREQQRPDAD